MSPGRLGRGELLAVLGGVVLALSRPGRPRGEISLQAGWFLAVAGCLLISLGGATRAASTERPRKPPGVL